MSTNAYLLSVCTDEDSLAAGQSGFIFYESAMVTAMNAAGRFKIKHPDAFRRRHRLP